ncbi:MAG TPA: electron transfer flavoprotein subunit alpha/FixB family protein [Candidatus Latescibacteria bacterium]|nr:electron transfer flavoprotein subunit alpha/FixB family protein [Candidatus Latescibacterota bacterium]
MSDIYSAEPDRDAIVVRDKPVDEAVALLVAYLTERGALDDHGGTRSLGPARGARRSAGPGGPLLVVAESLAGELRPVSLELLGKAAELAEAVGTSVEALLMGSEVESHAATLMAYGADTVHLADEPNLGGYDTLLYTDILAQCIQTQKLFAVLVPSTVNGRDLAARVAARLGLGLTGDCVGLEVDGEGRMVQLKPAFGGNIVAPILSRTMPQMATVRPGIMTPVEPDWSVRPAVERVEIGVLGPSPVELIESVIDPLNEGAELERARRVVGVGMGLGGPEGLAVARKLAGTIGAALGATRELCDAGWLPRQHQIGLSGKAVAPDLYIAVALRGPFNHTVGVQKAGTVVAINNSARAPIFKAADFGIVGDYREVVPVLTKALADRLGPSDL